MRNEVGIWMREPYGKPTDHGHAFFAIHPGVMTGTDDFPSRMDDLFRGIRGGPAVSGVDNVKIPGDIERRKLEKAARDGIDLPADVLKQLRVAAEENACRLPAFLG